VLVGAVALSGKLELGLKVQLPALGVDPAAPGIAEWRLRWKYEEAAVGVAATEGVLEGERSIKGEAPTTEIGVAVDGTLLPAGTD
jgi:hypothetical protein